MVIQKRHLNALIALTLSITTSVGLGNSSSFSSVQLSHYPYPLFQYAQAKGVGNPLVLFSIYLRKDKVFHKNNLE